MLRHSSLVIGALLSGAAMAQPVFSNGDAAITHNASSGGCMAVVDMDDDGLNDIVQLDMSTHVYVLYQNADHTFTSYDYGSVDGGAQWGWAIADIDNNGHKDIVSGVSTTHYLRITSRGVYTLTDLDGPDIFTQCMSIGDMNNDGKVDVFACHDNGAPNIWFTNASGVPVNNNAYINWATTPSSDMSGNYGSTYTDFDNDGDLDFFISHCRQGHDDPNDVLRWDRLFVNDGTNHFSDQAYTYGMQNHAQTWTTDFGDYDNDGDLDAFSTTHDGGTIMLFENDGTGHYSDVSSGSGLEVTGFFLQGLFRDFDNDGFLDVITAGAEFYFKGHGNGTFTQVTGLFPAAKEMHSFGIGDLNNDGFEDVYAGYGDNYVNGDPAHPDRLWLNTPNGNHYFDVRLKGVQSNKDAVGAKVTITGPWGTQVREVHAGESYGIVNSFVCHFGLGSSTVIPTVMIHWPSGQVDTYTDQAADQMITVVEGTCIAPTASIDASNIIVCTGGTPVTLTANPGFTYTWSTSATTQSIDVTTGGTYNVIIDAGGGCTGEASVTITQDPNETPTVTLNGDETFCEGGSATLTSSAASSYLWSNSANTQSIDVTTAGTYAVTVQGLCQAFTSAPITINVLAAPTAPVSNTVNIPVPGTAGLTATGTNITWYDAAIGGTQVGTGNNWTTPFLNADTHFWCSDATIFGGDSLHGGPVDRINTTTPGQYFTNNNFYLLFDAAQDFTIMSVKVYANTAGNRTIAVVDYTLGTTIASGTFNIPNGESRVQLNFAVPAGGPYGLRLVTGTNLWRDGNGSNPAFPYSLGANGAITGTSVTGGNALEYYYFFYDWDVQAASTSCASARTDVLVTVGPLGIGENSNAAMDVFPVPATDQLNIRFGTIAGAVDVELVDVTGRTVLDRHAQATGTMLLDVSSLAAGQYQLRVRHQGGTELRRVDVR